MTEDIHTRAEHLILQNHVEGICPREREWLHRHLEACPDCDRLASATERTLRSFCAVSVPVPPSLTSRTQLRIYLRMETLQTRERGGWIFWISCALSWAFGIASAPYVWRGFEWVGRHIGVSDVVWQMGFGLWWALPALVATGILLLEERGLGRSEHYQQSSERHEWD